jgi:hypothetical protein
MPATPHTYLWRCTFRHLFSKHAQNSTTGSRPRGTPSQQTAIFTLVAVRTSNLTELYAVYWRNGNPTMPQFPTHLSVLFLELMTRRYKRLLVSKQSVRTEKCSLAAAPRTHRATHTLLSYYGNALRASVCMQQSYFMSCVGSHGRELGDDTITALMMKTVSTTETSVNFYETVISQKTVILQDTSYQT